ncbi:unnamed protein product [Dracunculus medinensis]|uniref:39S ribosomal protein L37, mitochondrial n=1 Tax=Dracunculus medinensis TaxID=318479 RepID=A0A0N4UII0_DRAME|nr:unnamed protein product [Dracunculus medinensis]
MVFRKFRPSKQWGVQDTRIFKAILAAKNKRKMPSFQVPDSIKALDVPIYDPNDVDFPRPQPKLEANFNHPAYNIPSKEVHPLYKKMKCLLFDGTQPFTDGIDQACSLTKAVKRLQFPDSLLSESSLNQSSIMIYRKMASCLFHQKFLNDRLQALLPKNLELQLRDFILHGERYDPSLERLPRLHDPILFWRKHPVMYGTPDIKKGNIILDNIFRSIHLNSVQRGQLNYLRYDRDEAISGILKKGDYLNQPLVVRSEPHLVIQSPQQLKPWVLQDELSSLESEEVPDITPIHPHIDLVDWNIYNDFALVPRNKFSLHLDTIMWSKERNQKYPWTREQNAANAVMHCFGAALIEATRYNDDSIFFDNSFDLIVPIITRAVQLISGYLDLVVFQLNTLDFRKVNRTKNIVWVEHALQLYKPGKHTENYNEVVDLNVDPYIRLTRLLLTR